MNTLRINQKGFHLLEVIIILAVIGAIGLVGWKVVGTKKNNQDNSQSNSTTASGSKDQKSSKFIEWSFNGSTWSPNGTAPKCDEPLKITSPIDVSKANSKLLPGQVRGGDYKPHGGLGLDYDTHQNKVDVVALRDAYLYRGSRYIEAGEVQYMFDFMDSCGIMYRLDHLLTLTTEFAKYANSLPQPKADDSRTEKIQGHPFVKAGTVIATEVGFRNMKNPGFDIGVYDLRQPNAESKTNTFQTDSQRVQDKEQSYFAVCWFNLLSDKDKATVSALPTRSASETKSDFCK